MRAKDGLLWQPETLQKGSGLDSLVTADLRSRTHITQAQPATTESIFLRKVYRQWIVDVLSRSIPSAERRIDEVSSEHRSSCVKAINDYCVQEGWINIGVTCRSGHYAELERSGNALTIPKKQVIAVAPLEAARIERFLDQLDRVGIDVTHLHSLLEHERTPLMTDVILQTYEGKAADYLREVQVADVWENSVARKFEDEKSRRELAGAQQRCSRRVGPAIGHCFRHDDLDPLPGH